MPLWFFWWFFPFKVWFGVASVGAPIGVVFLLLVAVSFLDRSPARHWRQRKLSMATAGAVLLFLASVTLYVCANNPKGH